MCHSLAFETIDGTVRTLRHGEPRQVVADIRSFYRAGLRVRPVEFGTERSRPGDVNQVRAAVQTARQAGTIARADQAVRQVFSPGGACFDCHQVQPAPGGSLAYGIRPVAFPTRYMLHGWFDHRAHQITQRPGQPRQEGTRPASAATAPTPRPGRSRPAAAQRGELPRLPWRRDEPAAGGISCAMCHDYHMDEGVPARLLRQVVRERRWTTTVIPVEPQQASSPRAVIGAGRMRRC